jgi:hypothetical protein
MAKAIRRGGAWAMKADREIIALSKTHTLEAIANNSSVRPQRF